MISSSATLRKPAFLALSCVGAFATWPAFATEAAPAAANDADPDGKLDIIVTGSREQRPRDPKLVAPLIDTPKSIVVLDKSVIEQTGSTTLADALRTVPGITFGAAEGGNPIGDRPFIRGFDSQGSIYVDGVRDLGAQNREVFAIDSVQIVRGSDSTLGGRGNAGGSINILAKVPQARTFGSVAASYGNADYKRVSADVNVKLSDTAAVRIAGLWHDQDVAGRDAIYQRRWGVAPSVTIGLGTPTRLTIGYYYLESHELPDSGIPYLYTIGNAPGTGQIRTSPAVGQITTAGGQTDFAARSNFYGVASRDFRDSTTNQATIRVEHDFGGVTLRNTARYSHDSQAYIFTLPDDSTGNVYGTGQVWRRANTRYSFAESIVDQLDLSGSVMTGSIKHDFAVGAEVSWQKTRRGTFVTRGFLNASGTEILSTGATISPRCNAATVSRSYCTSIFAPNPTDPWVNYASDTSTTPAAIVRSLPLAETQNDAETQALYGFDSITLLPSLILNVGARYDRFTSRVTPGQPANATTSFRLSRTDELFNWQAGLVFKPTRETSLYASYATAATPPNSLLGEGFENNALPTTTVTANLLDSLRVQKTKTYEFGAKGNVFHEKLALGVAVFQTDISNARVTDGNNNIAFLGSTRIRGVEFNANGTILPGWTVFGGYTFLDATIVDGGFTALTAAANGAAAATTVLVPSVNTGKAVPQTARHSATLSTNVELTKRVSIGGGVYFMDKQNGGYADNRSATQTTAGVVTVVPATKILTRGIPSYWRFDLQARVKLSERFDLSVNAQNLTNKTYFASTYTNHYATIAPGRTVFGTLTAKF
ncbi:TonB-dependent receptor [Sphingomonas psychrolutea]|uniref:Iron transport receptor protein n=1 Tax=Sphingomonas psychrolutea TaxID=1259676 RepID=A0ABQ1H5A7_9SPHN|nr:TonB-dependent receptor [Sphingomonas psychrolutea]GGA59308.1 iron transport receptor protein [Sphingomonas psychrolutea]